MALQCFCVLHSKTRTLPVVTSIIKTTLSKIMNLLQLWMQGTRTLIVTEKHLEYTVAHARENQTFQTFPR